VAKRLMEHLLSGLRSSDYFNVLLFAGSNKLFSEQSVPYNSANLKRSLTMIQRERGAGGTELMPALRRGLALPEVGNDVARSIVVVTDGFVDVEKDAFDYIRNNLDKGNVFAFGIGSSDNRYLIEGMARAGMGEPFIALNQSDAETKANAFKTYIEAPVLTDISVKFNKMKVSEVEPPTIPDLFARRPVVLFGKYHGTPAGKIAVTGKCGNKKYKNEIRVSEGKVSTKNRALRYLWARHQIRRLSDMKKLSKENDVVEQITQLGLEYNLLTDYTSFIAVDTEKRTEGRPKATVKQPLPLPEGVSNNAVPASAMRRPVPALRRGIMHREKIQCMKKDENIDEDLQELKRQLEKEQTKQSSKETEQIKQQPLQAERRELQKSEVSQDKRQKLMEKIRKLEQNKQKLRRKVNQRSRLMNPPRHSIPEIITRYEKLLSNCSVKKSERCADVIYTLGTLYYDKARDDYIKQREGYEKNLERYEQSRQGAKPVEPEPDYSQALRAYERLVNEYPNFKKMSEAYYQMGTIYLLKGDTAKAAESFRIVAEKYPGSPRAGAVHFRLSDLSYLNKDTVTTMKHLEKVKEDQVDVQTWEMVHYRKAEVYFNKGEYEKALNLFYTYVEKCDAGLYPEKEFRDRAIEFMGVTFTDMNDGLAQAEKFFEKNGHKPYEPVVYFKMGGRYHSQRKYKLAVEAFYHALEMYPMYKNAPDVTLKLIECFNSLDNVKKAAEERARLVKEYGAESKWAETNAGDSTAMRKARAAIEKVSGEDVK